jgi:exonuclease VII large subunit
MIAAVAVFGLMACQQASEKTDDVAAAAEQMAEETGAAAAEMGNEMAQDTQETIDSLSADAKTKYDEYSAKLDASKEKFDELQQKLSEASPQDLLSGEGKKLKEQAEHLKTEIDEIENAMQSILDDAKSSE